MISKKRLAGVVAVFAMAFGASLAGGSAALGAYSQCASGAACAWNDANYTGGLLISIRSGSADFEPASKNDASSLANRTVRDVGWYSEDGLSGSRYCQTNGNNVPSLGFGWNDNIQSVIVYGNATTC